MGNPTKHWNSRKPRRKFSLKRWLNSPAAEFTPISIPVQAVFLVVVISLSFFGVMYGYWFVAVAPNQIRTSPQSNDPFTTIFDGSTPSSGCTGGTPFYSVINVVNDCGGNFRFRTTPSIDALAISGSPFDPSQAVGRNLAFFSEWVPAVTVNPARDNNAVENNCTSCRQSFVVFSDNAAPDLLIVILTFTYLAANHPVPGFVFTGNLESITPILRANATKSGVFPNQQQVLEYYAILNQVESSITMTVTSGGPSSPVMTAFSVAEMTIKSINTGTPFDPQAGLPVKAFGTSTSPTVTFTTTGSSDLLLSALAQNLTQGCATYPVGWTKIPLTPTADNACAAVLAGQVAGTYTATYALTISTSWAIIGDAVNSNPMSFNPSGTVFAYFLTHNSTLATGYAPNWRPLNDPEVVLISETSFVDASHMNNAFYVSTNLGQPICQQGQPNTCPIGAFPALKAPLIFFTGNLVVDMGGVIIKTDSFALNFTGTATTAGNNGRSYHCTGDVSGGGTACPVGGIGQATISVNAGSFLNYFQLPTLDLNSGPLYLGMVQYSTSAAHTDIIQITTGNGLGGNTVSIYVPTPAAPASPPATFQDASFFGWLAQTIGGAFTIAGNTLGGVFGPIINIGGSILNALISAIIQAVSIFIQSFKVLLNTIGNLFGWGNIGDKAFSYINNLVTYFTQSANALILDIITGILLLNDITTIAGNALTFYGSQVLAFLTGIIPILITKTLVLLSLIFTYQVAIATMFLVDYLLLGFMIFNGGVSAALQWMEWNYWFFTAIFRLINFLVGFLFENVIMRIKRLLAQWT